MPHNPSTPSRAVITHVQSQWFSERCFFCESEDIQFPTSGRISVMINCSQALDGISSCLFNFTISVFFVYAARHACTHMQTMINLPMRFDSPANSQVNHSDKHALMRSCSDCFYFRLTFNSSHYLCIKHWDCIQQLRSIHCVPKETRHRALNVPCGTWCLLTD